MRDLPETPLDPNSPGAIIFRQNYGFVPRVFRVQAAIPQLMEASASLANAILFRPSGLSRVEKECLALAQAAAEGSSYSVALHHQTLVLLGVPKARLDKLISAPGDAEAPPTLDAGLSLAWASFVGALASALDTKPDFAPRPIPTISDPSALAQKIHIGEFETAADSPVFASFRQQFSFVPNLFGVQASMPEALQAQAALISALRQEPSTRTPIEAATAAALAKFLNTLQIALKLEPDFALAELPWPQPGNISNLSAAEPRPTVECLPDDPDLDIVQTVRGGNVDAFEQLIERHSRRVYRTLVGILGDPEDARDAMQDTFLKAYQHLGNFQSRSKFSTWLVSIATNTALQRLRERRPVESLDETSDDSESSFRPRQVRAWVDDPEQEYSQAERRRLVENSVMSLPSKYRTAVVLRDLEMLSTEEAAAALGLEIPTLKTRLLRGRLMLREALAPHFTRRASEVAH
jgi:RNA polymerase sigma-70 factor (ECF subfamily)